MWIRVFLHVYMSMLYMPDVCEGLKRALTLRVVGSYHVGSKNQIQVP